MTNREKFERFMQGRVNLLRELSDRDIAICGSFIDELWYFAGCKWEHLRMGDLIPAGHTEKIVAWLREEAKDD